MSQRLDIGARGGRHEWGIRDGRMCADIYRESPMLRVGLKPTPSMGLSCLRGGGIRSLGGLWGDRLEVAVQEPASHPRQSDQSPSHRLYRDPRYPLNRRSRRVNGGSVGARRGKPQELGRVPYIAYSSLSFLNRETYDVSVSLAPRAQAASCELGHSSTSCSTQSPSYG